jgi:hypothetical protein
MAETFCRVMDLDGVAKPSPNDSGTRSVAKVCFDTDTLEVTSASKVRMSAAEIQSVEKDFYKRMRIIKRGGQALTDGLGVQPPLIDPENAAKRMAEDLLGPPRGAAARPTRTGNVEIGPDPRIVGPLIEALKNSSKRDVNPADSRLGKPRTSAQAIPCQSCHTSFVPPGSKGAATEKPAPDDAPRGFSTRDQEEAFAGREVLDPIIKELRDLARPKSSKPPAPTKRPESDLNNSGPQRAKSVQDELNRRVTAPLVAPAKNAEKK